MNTAQDLEAEYAEIVASMTPDQLWAVEMYGASRALVALERGGMLSGTPDELRVARALLFEEEARRRTEGVSSTSARLRLIS